MTILSSLDYLTDIKNMKTNEEISDSFKQRMHDLGVTQFTYRLSYLPDDVPSKFLCTTYRQDWAEYYFQNRLNDVDPVVRRLKQQNLPFVWGDHWDQKISKDDNGFFIQAGDFGYRNGVAIPLHQTSSMASALTLIPDVHRSDFVSWNNSYFPHYHSLAILFNEALLTRFSDKALVNLTDREKECLLWTANGKTNWEIGQLLSLSASTVKFHLANACRKLSVHSKHQAVLKAVEMGLIEP